MILGGNWGFFLRMKVFLFGLFLMVYYLLLCSEVLVSHGDVIIVEFNANSIYTSLLIKLF